MNQKKYQTPSLGCEPIRSQAILITNGLLFTFCMPKNIINNIRKQFDGVKASKLGTLSTFKKSKIRLLLWYLRKKIKYSPPPRTAFFPMRSDEGSASLKIPKRDFKPNYTSKKFWSIKNPGEGFLHGGVGRGFGQIRPKKKRRPWGGENTVVLTVRLVNSLFTVIWETFLFRWKKINDVQ